MMSRGKRYIALPMIFGYAVWMILFSIFCIISIFVSIPFLWINKYSHKYGALITNLSHMF